MDEKIDGILQGTKIVLFMKGTPDAPRCGFSEKASKAVKDVVEGEFGYFDVLSDEGVRQRLKERSNWPTYPQLYVDGELVGGCDIIMELAESGGLREELLGSSS